MVRQCLQASSECFAAVADTDKKLNFTRDLEFVAVGACQHPHSMLLLPLAKPFRVEGLGFQVVLHDIGYAHVMVHKAQLAERIVQGGQSLQHKANSDRHLQRCVLGGATRHCNPICRGAQSPAC